MIIIIYVFESLSLLLFEEEDSSLRLLLCFLLEILRSIDADLVEDGEDDIFFL